LFVRCLNETSTGFGFSIPALKRVRHFAAGMGAINVLSLLLTQLDKIVLSSILPLKTFGYYSLAWTLGTLIYRLTGPVYNAYYPKITQLVAEQNTPAMLSAYQQACRVMAVAIVPISLWLVMFGKDILVLWTRNDELAASASGALSVIALGTMFNGYMHIPYALQLAHSYTRIAVVQNVIAVILIAPLTWYFATHFNLTMAALPWLFVNCGYVLIGAPLMHRYLSIPGLQDWYVRAVIKPAIYSGCGMVAARLILSTLVGNKWPAVVVPACLAVGLLLAILSSRLVSLNKVREWKNTQ
jgi:O-antigen/teichoic acid export membrane protein